MELLDEAERKDGYRAACHANLLNDRARERQEYSFYPDPLGKRISSIAATYEIAKGSQIVTLHPSADNGYPHTRPGIMCFPVRPYTTSQLTETVLHEALHLHQRNNLDLWTTYSVKQGWWPVPKETIPEKWRLRCRINPDTMYSPFWSWDSHYIPLPLFQNEFSPSMQGSSVRWFDTRSETLFSAAPRSFVDRYGAISQPEHPFETGAVEISHKNISTENRLREFLTV